MPGQTHELFVPATATGSEATILTTSVGLVPLVDDNTLMFTGAEVTFNVTTRISGSNSSNPLATAVKA